MWGVNWYIPSKPDQSQIDFREPPPWFPVFVTSRPIPYYKATLAHLIKSDFNTIAVG